MRVEILLDGENLLELPEEEMIKGTRQSYLDDLSTAADCLESCF